MRIALAQLNPDQRRHRRQHRHDHRRDREARRARRRARRHAGDGAARLLHRRPGRGRGVPRGQRAGDAARSPRRRAASPRSSASSTATRRRRNDSGTIRKYNAAAVVRDGRVLQRARKSLLPNYRYFDDKRFFTPGGSARAGRRRPAARPRRASASRSARTCGTSSTTSSRCRSSPRKGAERAPQPQRVAVLSRQAARARRADPRGTSQQLRKPIVYVNTVGAADNGKNIIPFDGESLVYDGARPADRDRPAVRRGPADRRRPRPGARRTPALELPPIDREREMYDALVMALRDYMRKTGFTRADRGRVGRHRFGAGAGDRRRRARRRTRSPPSTCRRSTTPRRPGRSPQRLAAALGVALRRHPDPGDRRRASARCSRRTPTRSRAA